MARHKEALDTLRNYRSVAVPNGRPIRTAEGTLAINISAYGLLLPQSENHPMRERLRPPKTSYVESATQTDTNRKVMDAPWEDSLILAFRDMQWIRKIQNSRHEPIALLAQPPALMVKLDGNAESRAGDVLAGQNERYFLLEFKSSSSRFNTEKGKPVHARLAAASSYSPEDQELLRLSNRGHFLAYPEVSRARGRQNEEILPIHNVELRCIPYCLMIGDTSSRRLAQDSSKLDDVFYGDEFGLTREEMAEYLNELVMAAVNGGDDGAPFKAVIATPEGLFWPMGTVSDFSRFVTSVGLINKPMQSSPQQRLAEAMQRIEEMSWGNKPNKRSGPRNG